MTVVPTPEATERKRANFPGKRDLMALTTAEMRRRIRTRYGSTSGSVIVPEHLVVYEVAAREQVRGDYARWACQRRIDVVAVGLLHRTEYLIAFRRGETAGRWTQKHEQEATG